MDVGAKFEFEGVEVKFGCAEDDGSGRECCGDAIAVREGVMIPDRHDSKFLDEDSWEVVVWETMDGGPDGLFDSPDGTFDLRDMAVGRTDGEAYGREFSLEGVELAVGVDFGRNKTTGFV